MPPSSWAFDSLSRIAVVLSGYALGVAMTLEAGGFTPLLWVPMGFFLSAAFGAMHRSTHGALFPNPMANAVVGRIAALALLANYTYFRYSHFHHHAYTGTPSDTEPPIVLARQRDYLWAMLTTNSLRHFTLPALSALVRRDPPPWIPPRRHRAFYLDGLAQALVVLGVLGGLAVAPSWVIALYLGPLAVTCLFDAWFSIPEHYGCGTVREPTLSRSVTTARWIAYVQWEENFHAEHHETPAAPAPVCREMAIATGLPTTGYFRFHRGLLSELPA